MGVRFTEGGFWDPKTRGGAPVYSRTADSRERAGNESAGFGRVYSARAVLRDLWTVLKFHWRFYTKRVTVLPRRGF